MEVGTLYQQSDGSRQNRIAGERNGNADRLQHALCIGYSLARNVESGAMIYGSPNERQTQIDTNAPGPVVDLDRDVSLVVIHGNNCVVPSVDGLVEYNVSRDRTGCIDALFAGTLDGGRDLLCLFGPEKPTIGCMRIQCGNSDTGAGEPPRFETVVGQLDLPSTLSRVT